MGLYVSLVFYANCTLSVKLNAAGHFYRGFPSTIIPSTAVSLSIYFPSREYPVHYVPSPAGFPAGYRGNTAGKFPRRSLVWSEVQMICI